MTHIAILLAALGYVVFGWPRPRGLHTVDRDEGRGLYD